MGNEDLSLKLHVPDIVTWNYVNDLDDAEEKGYDVCLLSRNIKEKEAYILQKKIRAYTMFILDSVRIESWTKWIFVSRKATKISEDSFQNFLDTDIQLFFSYTYGEKFNPHSLAISKSFKEKFFGMDIQELI